MPSYYSGMDEDLYFGLYHHGTKGMKWGRRLYQNEDGSLTPLGRVRYGVGQAVKKTGNVIGQGAQAAGKYAAKKFKKKFPQFMSDEELRAHLQREKMELEYRRAMQDIKATNRGRKVLADILESSAKSIFANAINNAFARKRAEDAADDTEERAAIRRAREMDSDSGRYGEKLRKDIVAGKLSDSDVETKMKTYESLRKLDGFESGSGKKKK